ncbi:lactoylglutathione lyase [Oenococcus oeni]|nr:lactoylglutathione lyase [Oenococcus oeni]KGH55928.1 lactoylglutathione lyase [Oenococcus oeni S22]OIK79480.1 lactoylglutathione lyase [Oenococcus oeni]OIL89437.1 lactoylglutathione lyase [Oenococcus oeni]
MKPRKMRPKIIPADDTKRAYRFYRDVFESLRNPKDQTTLIVDGQPIKFIKSSKRIELELLVRDHLHEIREHLANNFLTEIAEPEHRFNKKIALRIHDSEGNTVIIEGNEDN